MEVLQYTQEDLEEVRKCFRTDEDQINRDIRLLKNWISHQKHLPQDQDDNFLKQIHLRCKFRLNCTMQKLENYYTIRGLYRDFFQEHNEEFLPSTEVCILLPMPHLGPNQSRVILAALQDKNPKIFGYRRMIKFLTLMLEVIQRYDYSIGDILLIDLDGLTVEYFWKIPLGEISKCTNLFQKSFSIRPLQVEIVNPPGCIDFVLNNLNRMVPKNIFERIHVHDTFDELHTCISPKYLPNDYGGSLESVGNLIKQWDRFFEKSYHSFNENYNNVSDESKRMEEILHYDSLGSDATNNHVVKQCIYCHHSE